MFLKPKSVNTRSKAFRTSSLDTPVLGLANESWNSGLNSKAAKDSRLLELLLYFLEVLPTKK